MSDNLRKQFPRLEIISQVKRLRVRKLLLEEFSHDPNFCKAIREIVRNALKKNIRFTDKDRKRLAKYRKVIIGLSKKHKSEKRMRSYVKQTGTGVFLPLVIPLVASIISELTS